MSAVTRNDINNQNQVYSMTKNTGELFKINSSAVIADTDYYKEEKIKSV